MSLGDQEQTQGSHDDYDYRFSPSLAPEAAEWTSEHIDFVAYGNHDNRVDNGQPYRDSFEVPIPVAGVDSPSEPRNQLPELSYSFDYGNVHFATFDSNTLYDPAALDADLD